MTKTPPVKYVPPKDGTRDSWAEPRPEAVKDNFSNFPVLPHSTDVGKEPVPEVIKEPSRIQPVPVEIVTPTVPTQELNEYDTYAITLQAGQGQRIASRRPNRKIIRIYNVTANSTVYLGSNPEVTDQNGGWPLVAGTGPTDYFEMKHQREVYAYNPAATAAPVQLNVYTEYGLEIE